MDAWQFVSLDLPPLLAASFSCVACALLGNYLVLRRLSLMGDAISHSVLPGIVAAFLLTSSRASMPVFVGAAMAGICSAVLIEIVKRYGRVESGAAMGVIFSIFFALGVLLLEQAAARSVDLDADCLLHGQLESIFWSPPKDLAQLLSLRLLTQVPAEIVSALAVMMVVITFVVLLYKELKIATFDPALATALGFHSTHLYTALMVLVACAVVASFKIVGSILVIAMIICPAAAARMCTDKLRTQIYLSAMFAVLCCLSGYVLAAFGPLWLGYHNSVNAAGMIAVMTGLLLASCAVCAPQHGVLARNLRRLKLAVTVRREDILAFIYRVQESGRPKTTRLDLQAVFDTNALTWLALRRLCSEKLIVISEGAFCLTQAGAEAAAGLVRTHRLWESYLVNTLGLKPDHVHDTAERLEHFTDAELRERVSESQGAPRRDPHGREIP